MSARAFGVRGRLVASIGTAALLAAGLGAAVTSSEVSAAARSGASPGWASRSGIWNSAQPYLRRAFPARGTYSRYTTSNPQGDTISDPASTGKTLEIQSAVRSTDPTTLTLTITTYAALPAADLQLFEVLIDTNLDGVADWSAQLVRVPPGSGGITTTTSSSTTSSSTSSSTSSTSSSSTTSTTLAGSATLDAGLSPMTPHILKVGAAMPTSSSVQISFPRSLIGGATTFDWAVAGLDISSSGGSSDVVPETPTVAPNPLPRVAGADRIATSVQASFFVDQAAGAVVLARDDNYPDALAGAPLAAAKHAPLLLTDPSTLDPRVLAEIQRVLPPGGTVYLLGGTGALAQAITDSITAAGYQVTRFNGVDRYDTAIKIAGALGDPNTLFFTTGINFPDALSAGAAASSRNGALLLTNGTTLPAEDQAYVQAHPSDTQFAIGGPAAAALPKATGIVGADRYDTSVRVATTFFASVQALGLASGVNFPDALSGGATMAEGPGPLLLTDPHLLSGPTQQYLQNNASNGPAGFLFGGPAAVTDTVRQAAITAGGF